ncbi:MAG: hypothetical protein KF691_04720 [Phycisphaeraceae bacterium]|nr:hypothetical protein [Phycisphaeraceae bacterium]
MNPKTTQSSDSARDRRVPAKIASSRNSQNNDAFVQRASALYTPQNSPKFLFREAGARSMSPDTHTLASIARLSFAVKRHAFENAPTLPPRPNAVSASLFFPGSGDIPAGSRTLSPQEPRFYRNFGPLPSDATCYPHVKSN